jgi:hypothetical protein
MTPEDRAEKLLADLVSYETTVGYLPMVPENNPNTWFPQGTMGESYVLIRDAIRAAVAQVSKALNELAEEQRCA